MIRRIGASSSKPLSSTLEILGHQFLQRCSVSGTPKGKGRVKAAGGTPLKRSKITTKKTAANAAGDSGVPRGRNALDQIISDCLNAPTPLRHLTPKQRAREDMRAKLDLKSKDALREEEMLKKKAAGGGEKDAPVEMGTPGLDYIALGLVDADKIPKYELTEEDGKRLAKEYSQLLMRKKRERQAAETTLLRLKKEAIEALPQHLKAAALVPDLAPFPANRFMATLTPPIEGHQQRVMEAAKQTSSRHKRR